MSREVTLVSGSSSMTKKAGEALGALLVAGDYVCLYGDLGAGKTTFVQGMALGFGVIEEYITSPSYTLVNEYKGRTNLYHIDLYRVAGPAELTETGFTEYPGDGVAAVEWPGRAGELLPEARLEIYFSHAGADTRIIRAVSSGRRYESLLEELCRNTPWQRP